MSEEARDVPYFDGMPIMDACRRFQYLWGKRWRTRRVNAEILAIVEFAAEYFEEELDE